MPGVVASRSNAVCAAGRRGCGVASPALPVADGGTGQGTKTAAFDALAPATTKGDLIVHDGTDHVREGVGTDGQALVADSGALAGLGWADRVFGATINVPLPDNPDEFLHLWFPEDARILEVYSIIAGGSGTISFDLINRPRGSSHTGGTNITSSAFLATTSGTTTTTFVSSGDIDADRCLVYKKAGVTTAPTLLRIFVKWRLR